MSNLYKWKLAPTPLCAVCLVPEDIEHMFIACESLGHFWKQVDDLMSYVKLGFVVNLPSIILANEVKGRATWKQFLFTLE